MENFVSRLKIATKETSHLSGKGEIFRVMFFNDISSSFENTKNQPHEFHNDFSLRTNENKLNIIAAN